jgi:hypothetical protein
MKTKQFEKGDLVLNQNGELRIIDSVWIEYSLCIFEITSAALKIETTSELTLIEKGAFK